MLLNLSYVPSAVAILVLNPRSIGPTLQTGIRVSTMIVSSMVYVQGYMPGVLAFERYLMFISHFSRQSPLEGILFLCQLELLMSNIPCPFTDFPTQLGFYVIQF